MKANEALKASKDGYIYLNGRTAVRHAQYHLVWVNDRLLSAQVGQVSDDDLFSEDWQPSKPEEKCPACMDVDNMLVGSMSTHLRKYHCTCKGKHETM